MKRKQNRLLRFNSDVAFDAVNVVLMVVLLGVFAWPLWFVVIASFSDPTAVSSGQVLLLPKGMSLEGFKAAFEQTLLWTGYRNSVLYTLGGTLLNLVLTVCCAYPLANREFVPRRFFLIMFMITMYFGGGMIPTYLIVKNTGLIDTPWAMIIPNAISFYNCLIVRSYFMNSIPKELNEAATLDGANSFHYLIKVVLPLSKPVLAVVGLYYAVSHWNNYYSALLYLRDTNLYPLQSVLRELLIVHEIAGGALSSSDPELATLMFERSQLMKYAVIIIATLPMMALYPFIQKYFVKGVMVGSVKG